MSPPGVGCLRLIRDRFNASLFIQGLFKVEAGKCLRPMSQKLFNIYSNLKRRIHTVVLVSFNQNWLGATQSQRSGNKHSYGIRDGDSGS